MDRLRLEVIMRTDKATLLLVIGVLGMTMPVFASDPIPAPKQKKPIALVGGTIHTVSGAVIESGIILFDNGKITGVGTSVTMPPDVEKIDVAGKQIYPGIIDACTDMGLTEIGSVRGTLDRTETGSINPNVRAEVAVNPESELVPVARSNGVTIAVSAPSGGIISGTSAALMMDGWTADQMVLQTPLGLVMNWPSLVYVPNQYFRRSKEEWEKQRDQALDNLHEAFVEARAYLVAKQSESQKGVPYHDFDARWEAMIPVLEGKMPVWVNADELCQIQAAIAWAEQEKVKLVIVGGRDAWRVADQLKAKDIPVILMSMFDAPMRRWEPYDVVFAGPRMLHEKGVRFCIAGDGDASNARNVQYNAAIASAYGLPKEEALRSVTLSAAEILGIADRVGSLDVGKDATLLIANGDPLSQETVVEQVYIQGRKIDMRDKHKQLYAKYKEKYRQLREQ